MTAIFSMPVMASRHTTGVTSAKQEWHAQALNLILDMQNHQPCLHQMFTGCLYESLDA